MIQDSVNRISYDGNGIATEFAYPFSITSTQDVKVMLVDTDGTETILTADYYVDEANSKVDYPGYPPGEEPLPELQPPVLADGQRIVIYRELDVTQLTSLFDQYPFKTIEVMIDKTTILLQQLKDAQQRALTLSVSTDTGVSLILPAPSPNKSFRWNAAGTGLELTADPATVLASVQGYTDLAEGYATTANEKAGIATAGANTATEQAGLAIEAAETFTLATQAEAEAGTENTKAMTSLRTLQALLANIATQLQAETGTENTKFVTSLRVKQAITSQRPTYITETYHNGTEWYRVWSDGFIEQGGHGMFRAAVTFLKAFSNTDYSLNVTALVSNGSAAVSVTSYSATTFNSQYLNYGGTFSDTAMSWKACGY